MNALKYLGVLILFIGVAILAVPAMSGQTDNILLLVGLALIIVGYFSHIALNKIIQ